MKLYVVCEDYTCAFIGLFDDKAKANATAKEVGGWVEVYDLDNREHSQDGRLVCLDGF